MAKLESVLSNLRDKTIQIKTFDGVEPLIAEIEPLIAHPEPWIGLLNSQNQLVRQFNTLCDLYIQIQKLGKRHDRYIKYHVLPLLSEMRSLYCQSVKKMEIEA